MKSLFKILNFKKENDNCIHDIEYFSNLIDDINVKSTFDKQVIFEKILNECIIYNDGAINHYIESERLCDILLALYCENEIIDWLVKYHSNNIWYIEVLRTILINHDEFAMNPLLYKKEFNLINSIAKEPINIKNYLHTQRNYLLKYYINYQKMFNLDNYIVFNSPTSTLIYDKYENMVTYGNRTMTYFQFLEVVNKLKNDDKQIVDIKNENFYIIDVFIDQINNFNESIGRD